MSSILTHPNTDFSQNAVHIDPESLTILPNIPVNDRLLLNFLVIYCHLSILRARK